MKTVSKSTFSLLILFLIFSLFSGESNCTEDQYPKTPYPVVWKQIPITLDIDSNAFILYKAESIAKIYENNSDSLKIMADNLKTNTFNERTNKYSH